MSIDAPDWQRQITVNTTVVPELPINIASQDLSRVLVKPDFMFDRFVLAAQGYKNKVLTAGQTLTLLDKAIAGIGFIVRLWANNPLIAVKVEMDGTPIISRTPYDMWTGWAGNIAEDLHLLEILCYDSANNIYQINIDRAWVYRFLTGFKLQIYNGSGGSATANSIQIIWMEGT